MRSWGGVAALMAALVMLSACAQKTVLDPVQGLPPDSGDAPRSIAVLPFSNPAGETAVAQLIRSSFYSHLCVLPFRDIELTLVDNRLASQGLTDDEILRAENKAVLGRLLGCDAVVFGRVTRFDSLYAALYSRFCAGAEIEIWDTRSGKRIWQDSYVAASHEGGIPLSLWEIPLVSLRTGLNLRESERIGTVDDLTRYLALRVPAPGGFQGEQPLSMRYTLQAGAFIEPQRAEELTHTLRERGWPAFMRKNREEDGLWHRVILGPYQDREEVLRVQAVIRKELGLATFVRTEPAGSAQ